MTGPGESGGPDGQVGPGPRGLVSLEELADLDAGLLTDDEERLLRRRIARDPDAAEMLAALEQVRTDLGELDDEPVPEDVAARIDAALAAETATAGSDSTNAPPGSSATPAAPDPETAPVVDLAGARAGGRTGARRGGAGRSRMQRWAVTGLSVAAAAVVAVVVGAVVRDTMQTHLPQPGSAPGDAAPTLSVADLPAQWPGITQFRDLGFLVAPDDLEYCLASSGTSPDQLLGARPVVVDDQYGVLVAVPKDPLPDSDVRLIVLGPHCDASLERDVIAETVVPR